MAARRRGSSATDLQKQLDQRTHELAEAQKLSNLYSSLARLKKVQPYDSRHVQALAEPTLFAGLRNAGMPEE